ncbi:MAG TPA: cation transporter [Patescibacteria group bacterium]|nr:cation transporter [Patescibacteria group bacterium]
MQKSKVKTYKIKGMDCASCASLIEMDLEDAGVSAKCSYVKETLEVKGDFDPKKIASIVSKSGFSING